jgi:hypothetical protein
MASSNNSQFIPVPSEPYKALPEADRILFYKLMEIYQWYGSVMANIYSSENLVFECLLNCRYLIADQLRYLGGVVDGAYLRDKIAIHDLNIKSLITYWRGRPSNPHPFKDGWIAQKDEVALLEALTDKRESLFPGVRCIQAYEFDDD